MITEEDKELLLKDLCARLPYGTYVHHKNFPDTKFKVITVFDDGRIGVTKNEIPLTPTSINECKPYLRPMSSMTEEEKKTLNNILEYQYCSDDSCMCEASDWLNENHFDYRGLIPMGLALEAPEGMYKED